MSAGVRVLKGFAGPGGFDEAARMIGMTGCLGIDIDRDACATATAAGFKRIQADIRALNPADFPDATTWVSGPPCPPYAESGKHSGLTDYRIVLDGINTLGNAQGNIAGDDDYKAAYRHVEDERSALVLETLRFAFRLPNVRVVIAEQVPAVHEIWMHVCAELAAATGWKSCNVLKVRFSDFGAPTRRERVILVAVRDYWPDFTDLPLRGWWSAGRFESPRWNVTDAVEPLADVSMAGALDWPAGVQIRTRGNRRTPGGNLFSADGPSQGLTEKARSWTREDQPGHALTPAEAGLLQSFPRDFPWQGSRSSQFLQIANTVSPLVGAAVLGAATGRPWQDAVRERIEQLYGPAVLEAAVPAAQLDLLAGVAA